MKAEVYSDATMPPFLGNESDPKGKVYDGTVTNAALKWKPKHASFEEYMSSQS
jgi:hypothetical protein